ncbi:MAG TPA: Hsp20/alpha crystallin family protein [Thermoanaerobaculia bacterium]
MNLIRREPTFPLYARYETPFFREMEGLSERFNKLFSNWTRPFDVTESLKVADWAPAVDIQETEKEYLVKLEIPEVKKEDVKVTFQENELTVTGERRLEKEEKGKKFHRIERAYGTFVRTFAIPIDADETKIFAEFKDGMLIVKLPKLDKPRPKTVEVKVS